MLPQANVRNGSLADCPLSDGRNSPLLPPEGPRWVESGHCDVNQFAYPLVMTGQLPKSVGLGGDGNEVAAIEDVERAFCVKLDDADAPSWLTAGDVFKSLQRALPSEALNDADSWNGFSVALCSQTGVNPDNMAPDSPLLSQSRLWVNVSDAWAAVWIAAAAAMLALVAWAVS